MKTQTYYITPGEKLADICDTSKELLINCAGAVDDSSGFRTSCKRRDYYMIYVLEGSMNIEFGKNKSLIKAGELLILRPGTECLYYAEKDSGINYLWIHFTGSQAEEIVKSFSIPLNAICNCGQIRGIREYWEKMFYEFVLNDIYFQKMTALLFNEILTYFSRHLGSLGEMKNLMKSIVHIHENYQKNLTVKYLASMENLSESHYRLVFRRITGESPIEYITSRRIEVAVDLLENTNKKLSEISALVGYSDAYYFGKMFKKKLGVSPGKFRKGKKLYES